MRLIENAKAVYTVTSQVGFEALIWGKPVRCFGMPFYAGWGLTRDELPPPARRHPVPVNQLVHGALIRYARYIDPERKERCEIETVLDHLGLQRRMLQSAPKKVFACGFSRWKRPVLRRFLAGSDIRFVRDARDISADATVAVWGNAQIVGLSPAARILRIEDGFLRSAGLGADLVTPLSWVVDDIGIYYDSGRPSRLELILQDQIWTDDELARAARLRQAIRDAGISKYNLASRPWRRPDGCVRVILVPGQVENDASLRYGAPGICSNIGLLQAVRTANPDAFIVYKPHPDVASGLRRAGSRDADALTLADSVVTDADAVSMLPHVDEVHTLTSLLGFEALLRDVPVTCYGQPFYAGWGLTTDVMPIPRRSRRISVDELVLGALLTYPRYVSRMTQSFTTPERTVEELIAWRSAGGSQIPLLRRGLRVVLRAWAQSRLRKNG